MEGGDDTHTQNAQRRETGTDLFRGGGGGWGGGDGIIGGPNRGSGGSRYGV